MSVGKICPFCMEAIKEEDDVYMVAVERPYCNIFFHLSHFNLINSDLYLFLSENPDRWYNSIDNIEKEN